MKKLKLFTLLSAAALTVSACASNFAPGFYEPQLSEPLNGRIQVTQFTSDQPELAQKSAKAGMADMNNWLSEFFTDAVMQEFMQMDAYDDSAKCALSGEITHYDWGQAAVELDVTYGLQKNGETVFTTKTKSVRPMHKSMQLRVAQTMLHRTMTDSLNQLIKNDMFVRVLNNCN